LFEESIVSTVTVQCVCIS